MSGSAKNVTPKIRVFAFMNMYEDVILETNRSGTTSPASLRRGSSFGNGAVASSALISTLANQSS